jgi:hypothetical protein
VFEKEIFSDEEASKVYDVDSDDPGTVDDKPEPLKIPDSEGSHCFGTGEEKDI